MNVFRQFFKEQIEIEEQMSLVPHSGSKTIAKHFLSQNLSNRQIELIAANICRYADRQTKGKEMYAKLASSLCSKLGPIFISSISSQSKGLFMKLLYNYGVITIDDVRPYIKTGAKEWIFFAIELNFGERCFGEFSDYYYRRKQIRRSGFVDFVDLIRFGYKRNTNEYNIKYDMVELLKESKDFDPNVPLNVLHFDSDINNNTRALDFAAFYGSENCFDYIMQLGQKPTTVTLDCALIGNNKEIVGKILKEMDKTHDEYHFNTSVIVKYHLSEYYSTIPEQSYSDLFFFAMCIEGCNSELMQRCIESGINMNDPHYLVCAVGSGFLPAVDMFLSIGIGINQRDSSQVTPLAMAAKHENVAMVRALLEKGAKARLCEGCAMEMAVKAGNNIIMEILMKENDKIDINKMCGESNTLLHWAALYGQPVSVQFLISHKANVEAKNSMGYTPLISSAFSNDEDTAQILIKSGAKIDEAGIDQKTALIIAVERNNESVVHILLHNGADPNIRGPFGKTALFFASSAHMIEKLIKSGADPMIRNANDTPLIHHACKELKVDCVELLLQYFDIECLDKEENTPFLSACAANNTDVMLFLMSRGCNTNAKNRYEDGALHILADSNNTESLIEFLKHHPYADDANIFGRTPLHVAAISNYGMAVEVLMKYNPNIEALDNTNQTPFQLTSSRTIKKMMNPNYVPSKKRKSRKE